MHSEKGSTGDCKLQEEYERSSFDPHTTHLRPFVLCPPKLDPNEITDDHEIEAMRANKEWLPRNKMALPIQNLFLDIVLATALNTFTASHGATSPSEIGSFFTYFIIFEWLAISQMLFDVRFQADDWTHRIARFCQFVCIAYFSAFSAGWDPSNLGSYDLGDPDYVDSGVANQSWRTVTAAYAASRALLALQYLHVTILANRVSRPWKANVWAIAGLLTSAITATISAAIGFGVSNSMGIKIGLFYGGIAIEIATFSIGCFSQSFVEPKHRELAERCATFSLIIIGEGLNDILGNFAGAINSISLSDNLTFFRVFLVISSIYFLWTVWFIGEDFARQLRGPRSALWLALHVPLHFCLITFLFGMSNDVTFGAWLRGVNSATNQLGNAIDFLAQSLPLPDKLYQYSQVIDRLNLQPSWVQEIQALNESSLNTDSPTQSTVMVFQYLAQIISNAASSYDLNTNDGTDELYGKIQNYTIPANATQGENELQQMVLDFFTQLKNANVDGGLWLLPTAGGCLLLASALNFVRYRHGGFWIIAAQLIPLVLGFLLVLLTLFNIGSKEEAVGTEEGRSLAIIVELTKSGWAIGIVALVYVVAELGIVTVLGIGRWREQRRITKVR